MTGPDKSTEKTFSLYCLWKSLRSTYSVWVRESAEFHDVEEWQADWLTRAVVAFIVSGIVGIVVFFAYLAIGHREPMLLLPAMFNGVAYMTAYTLARI